MKKQYSHDMTTGPLTGPIVLFILPLMGSSIFQQLYNTVDFLYVGNFLSRTSAAAVGASSTLITCVIGLFSGVAAGTGVVISHAAGAGDRERADRAAHTAVLFGLLGGVVLTVCGIAAAPPVLRLLRTPEAAVPEAVVYMRIYLLSLPAMVLYNTLSGVLRSVGDSAAPFLVLALCGLFNTAADFLFVRIIRFHLWRQFILPPGPGPPSRSFWYLPL